MMIESRCIGITTRVAGFFSNYTKQKMSERDWELLRLAAEREKDELTLKEMVEVLEKQQLDAASARKEDKVRP
ncbi:hypothetical protein [Neorhodopirellula pilleata]|uniref:Uncharacterized protein n=1 Tax=Neorhodopirellula pilleata TaxID=2714738 RepID=A0A5C5ZGX6_9BACT|nr:hypothetical protein [Neorhodopirellula pilleata]TWT86365.1 hypothetical protein Pla100_61140 [Neorhodopirellula pilleata]